MSSKKCVVEIRGEEVVLCVRYFIIEVPDDVTETDIENLDVTEFDQIADPPCWSEVYSEGFVPISNDCPEVVEIAGDDETIDARLIRGDDGKLAFEK